MPLLGLWRPEDKFSKVHAFCHVGPRIRARSQAWQPVLRLSIESLVGSNIKLFFKLKTAKLEAMHITRLEGCEGRYERKGHIFMSN